MDIINKIVNKINDKTLSFFCGAGISYNSGIPIVGKVNDDGNIIDGIETYMLKRLGFNNDDIAKFVDNIPFEAFIETLIDNYMPLELFASIFNAEPNNIHHFIAELIPANKLKYVATTNFDDCFEKAFNQKKVDFQVIYENEGFNNFIDKGNKVLFKLHGSINDLHNMGITIKNIAKKENLAVRKKVVDTFFSKLSEIDTILILGYSCSDILDLTQWVSSISNNTNIIFINHTQSDNITYATDVKSYTKPYNMFSGFKFDIINCNTDKLIAAISEKLNIQTVRQQIPTNTWQPILDKCIENFVDFPLLKLKGNLYYLIQDYENSLSFHNRSLSLANKDEQKIIALRNIGFTYFRMNKFDNAMQKLDEALKLAEQIKANIHKANVMINLGSIYGEKGNWDMSLSHFLQALELTRKEKLEKEECFVVGNIGSLYNYMGKNELAIHYTKEGIELAQKRGFVETEGIFSSNLGNIYYDMKDYENAANSVKRALKIAREIGDKNGELNRNISLIKTELKSTISNCLTRCNKLLNQSIQYNNELYTANCKQLMGELYHADNNINAAMHSWEEAKEIYNRIGSQNIKITLEYINQHSKTVT